MISGCGFPDREGNYDGLLFQIHKLFDDVEVITCVEAPMLNIKEAAPLAEPYLEQIRMAGKEYARDGKISKETHKLLEQPMMDPEAYRQMCSNK